MPRLRCTPALVTATVLLAACASTPTAHPTNGSVGIRVDVPPIERPTGESPEWWFREGAAQAAERGAMDGRARNVILFVGDGMSLNTVAAARILDGQQKGGPGEENRLSWEQFPSTALSRTYNTDSQTPDSAGTMSAMATGVKTRAGVLSIGQAPRRRDCGGALASPMLSLWELAAATGMATGVISTARVTHATPGATFSHSADRDWEHDGMVPADATKAGCIDIARQMIETPFGHGPDVLLGGGRAMFMHEGQSDPEYPDLHGKRRDGRDLVADWQARHPDGHYAWNASQLAAAPNGGPLLGLFQPSHMQFEHDRARDAGGEPSLAEMTRIAISRLRDARDGYVLLIEGGRIDHANHFGNAYRALTDTIALSEAVQVATEMTSADDTLVLVTADHSHTLTFVGYPTRGNPILGKVRGASSEEGQNGRLATDSTGLPYTTLSYANGPGYAGASELQGEGPKRFPHSPDHFEQATRGRPDLSAVDTRHPDYLQEALLPTKDETHGGDDVGVWARGPGSAAVRGSVEQNTVYHFMLQATPRLRQALCEQGGCDRNGVPVALPDYARFKER